MTGDPVTCRATRKWRRLKWTIPLAWSRATRSSPCVRSATIRWARMHSHRHIDEAQYQGGRAFQADWEKAERGPQAVDPTREYVDGGEMREPITEGQRKAVLRLNRAERELGADGSALVHDVLDSGHDHGADRTAARIARPALDRLFRAQVSGMSRPAGVDLRIRDGETIVCTATSRSGASQSAGNTLPLRQRLLAGPARQISLPVSRTSKLASIAALFCIRLAIAGTLRRRLPSVANAQNPDDKGWVSREGSL